MYVKINEKNEMNIIYKINKKEKRIKLFGSKKIVFY